MSFYDRVMERYLPQPTIECGGESVFIRAFLFNSNTTMEFILLHPEIIDFNSTDDFNYYRFNRFVASTRNITIDIVLAHPEIKWGLTCLAKCPGITIDDILAHPELPWNYEHLSENPNLNWEIVYNNPGIKWDIRMLMLNQSLGCQTGEPERTRDEILCRETK